MTLSAGRFATAAVLSIVFVSNLFAQGSATSTISGVVTDTAGGVIPGATVVVSSNATGTKFEAVTGSSGAYSVPALSAGVYTVTVSLAGFKTAQVTDVRVQLGIPSTVNATLDVGSLAETITVQGGSAELINTLTPSVTATLNVDQIAQIPTPTRDVLNAVTYMVGVNQTGTARGNATVNGLPESFLNITLDGISNQDNFNKTTDAFFAPVRPRQDAIEAVSVTSAAGGADVGGHGAVSINFVTRQGTNRFAGSAYEYFRHPSLNTNYWFNKRNNLEKNDVRLNQFGGRQGGPIIIPNLYDGRGKAFFFVHYEQLHLPNNSSRTRTILHPRALEGVFRYSVAGAIREVNLFDLARANGQLASTDPTVMRLLGQIQSAVQTTGTVSDSSDPLLRAYDWLSPALQTERQPAIRIDYNIGANHRLTGTFNKLWQDRNPDQLNDSDHQFPGSPNIGHTIARRPSRSLALRSTLRSNLVNELRFGITRGERISFAQRESGGPDSFADQDGYAIDFDADIGLSNWHTTNTLSGRSAYQYTIDENLSWQTGKHSLTFGGAAFLGRGWTDAQQNVPGISLGFDTNNDPAAGMFNTNNFLGASGNQLTDARQLYGLLTGRVISIGGQATLDPETNRYSFLGNRRRAGKIDLYSAFIQDQWRITPTFTFNAGLRWDLQMPFIPSDNTMTTVTLADICGTSGLGDGGIYTACRFNTPGASGGKVPEYSQFTTDSKGYNTDWNNFAPNVGIAWRPEVETGLFRTLLGDPEQATLRAGYSVAYERNGLGVFTGVVGDNPGNFLSLTRNANTGLVPAGQSWPVLFRERNRLFPASFPETPTYPIAVRPNRADSLNGFHPDIKIASAHSWTVGLQRAITKDMAAEVRYVGTRGVDQWSELNYNARNIIENGFLDEFKLAMANLQANNAAGGARAGSFAYFGPGTGTAPLPIYLAYIAGRRDATNIGAYTGGTWTNTALTADMVHTRPQPFNSAADLDGDLARRNFALAAGLQPNFFVLNPDANAVNVLDSGAFSDYHALQLELRRRLSRGLSFHGSYQYALESGSAFEGFRYGRTSVRSTNTPRHAIKTQWNWELPVGRGQRFGANMHPILNGILGGWDFTGATRTQATMVNFGNVRLVGMTLSDLQKMYKYDIRINPDNGLLTPYMLPDDVILNTRRAFNTSPTSPNGYSALGAPEGRYFAPADSANCIEVRGGGGDCAPKTTIIRAPFFSRVDIGITKRFDLAGQTNFEFRLDVLNLFDNINFNPVANPGTGGTIFTATSAYRDPDNTFDPGGRLAQLSFRLNW